MQLDTLFFNARIRPETVVQGMGVKPPVHFDDQPSQIRQTLLWHVSERQCLSATSALHFWNRKTTLWFWIPRFTL